MTDLIKLKVPDPFSFPFPVRSAEVFMDGYLIILSLPDDCASTQNVYYVSNSGSIKWQIERCWGFTGVLGTQYVSLLRHSGSSLFIRHSSGLTAEVDKESGTIIAWERMERESSEPSSYVWRVRANTITLSNGSCLCFDNNIFQILEYNAVYVLILSVPAHAVDHLNVFGVTPHGSLLWRIERNENFEYDSFAKFTEGFKISERECFLRNNAGLTATIDVVDGRIKAVGIDR